LEGSVCTSGYEHKENSESVRFEVYSFEFKDEVQHNFSVNEMNLVHSSDNKSDTYCNGAFN